MAGENIESTTTSLIRHREDGEEKHGRPKEPWKGEYVKSIVYAGLDAIISCFSLISSISANRSSYVLVLGFANLVADGISMGLGDYISSRTKKAVAAKERAITEWDVKNHRGPQQLELLRQYQALGMDINDTTTVVEILAKYKDILVDEKMMAGKRIRQQDEAEKPWKNGLVTSASSIVFGSAPLLSCIILSPFTDSDSVRFTGACVLSGFALALLGIAKAKIAAQKYAFSVAFTLFNGAIAAAAAYTVSWTLKNIAGVED